MSKLKLALAGVMALGLVTLAGIAGAHSHGHCAAGYLGGDSAFAGPMMDGRGHMGHLLRRLDLTEQQRDQIFDIMHAQAPAARDKVKQLREGRKALTDAVVSGRYDPQQVRTLADAQAKLVSDLIVMRTETFSKVYQVLTPEQRAKAAQWKDQWKERRQEQGKDEAPPAQPSTP